MKRKILIGTLATLSIFLATLTPISIDVSNIFKRKTEQVMVTENKKDLINIILQNAEKNQTLLFGGKHEKDAKEVKAERKLIIDLLPELQERGYNDIAFQIYKEWQIDIDRYKEGKTDEATAINSLPHLENMCGYELIAKAFELGMNVWLIDGTGIYDDNFFVVQAASKNGTADKMLFDNLEEKVFKKRPDAKVIGYLGGHHTSEQPGYIEGKTLAMRLNEYTNNKNFSISIEGKEFPDNEITSDLKVSIYEIIKQEN